MSAEKPEQKCHRCGPILPRKWPCQQPLCPLEQNAAPQEVETYGVSSASPGPLAVTDEESTRPAGAAPETGAGDYKLQYLKQELKNSGDPRIIVAIGEIENQAATIAALRREVEELRGAVPCCQDWDNCQTRCLPLAENWRMAAKAAERELAHWKKRAEVAEYKLDESKAARKV